MPAKTAQPEDDTSDGLLSGSADGLGRITERKDYLAVAHTRRRWVTTAFILQAKPGDTGDARVGFTVSKKVGNAVKRSRAKRRLKEAVRLAMPARVPAGWDYVVIGREAAIHYPFERLQKDLAWAVAKLKAGADLKQSNSSGEGGKPYHQSGAQAAGRRSVADKANQ